MRLVILLTLQFLYSIQSFGQKIKELTVADGLSYGAVRDILQTKDGYLWIATQEGLNRYDGYDFRLFGHTANKEFSLPQNYITTLFEDSKQRLWIATKEKGLFLFNRKLNRFYQCELKISSKSSGSSFTAYKIIEDKSHDLWVGTNESMVFRLELPKNWDNNYPTNNNFTNEVKIQNYQITNDQKDIISLMVDAKNNIWIGNESGQVFTIDNQNHQIKTLEFGALRSENAKITGIFEDKEGTVWFVNRNSGLYRFKDEKITNFQQSLNGQLPLTWLDSKHNLWLKFKNDSRIWKSSYTDYTYKFPYTKEAIINSNANSFEVFYESKDGTIFIGDFRGIKKISPQKTPFKHLMAETNINSVFCDRNNNYYFSKGSATFLYDAKKPFSDTPYFNEVNRVSMLQSKNGDFWAIGFASPNFELTVFHYTETKQLLNKYPLGIIGESSKLTPPIIEDKNGNIWSPIFAGKLLKIIPSTKKTKVFDFQKIIPPISKTHKGRCWAIFEAIDHKLWIASEDGCIKVDNLEGNTVFYHISPAKIDGNSGDVHSIIDDPYQPQRYLWMGLKNGGLQRLDKSNNEIKVFSKAQGLPHNSISGILQDESKHFWVSTLNGIFKFDPKTFKITSFTRNDGLQSEVFSQSASYKAANGNLMFGGNNGFNVFKPSSIVSNATPPNVKISSIEINRKLVDVGDELNILDEDVEDESELNLGYDQNTLRLNFTNLNFSNTLANRFRYQLEGFDDNIVESGDEHSVTYSQLPTGNYTFKLWATSDGDVWSEKPLVVYIQVHSPWFWSWWSKLLYLLVAGYIVFRFYQNQINKVKLSQELLFNQKEKERLAELDEMKTHFFTNISHEFRTPLTLILAPAEDLIKKNPTNESYKIIKRNASRLLQLINQVLDLSKLESKQMQVKASKVEMVQYFRTLTSAYTSLAESREITFTYEQNQDEFYGIIDMDKVEKVINNLLSNALKFTEKGGGVTIKIDRNTPDAGKEANLINTFSIVVKDTGIGISKDKLPKVFNRFYQIDDALNRRFEGTGIGLALVRELVEVMGGTIHIESEVGVGTTFFVELPLELPFENLEEDTDISTVNIMEFETVNLSKSTVSQTVENENILLIVDDNSDIRAYIRSVFEKEYQIIEAVNGKDGLTQAFEHIPNLIISDLMMPEMDGFEFCKTIKSDNRTSHIPVIMLTAKATVESRIEGLELGADDYLAKPFYTDEIKARVANLIAQREVLKEKYSKTVLLDGHTVEKTKILSIDEIFLQKAYLVIEQNIDKSSFEVDDFCKFLAMSRTTMHRKLKALTNQSTTEFIRNYRLEKARELLKSKAGNVSEVAYQVGFESLPYFSKTFQERFGVLPSEIVTK